MESTSGHHGAAAETPQSRSRYGATVDPQRISLGAAADQPQKLRGTTFELPSGHYRAAMYPQWNHLGATVEMPRNHGGLAPNPPRSEAPSAEFSS